MNKTNISIPVESIILIENYLKNMEESLVTLNDLKKKLPKKLTSKSIMLALRYLQNINKIIYSPKGVTWIQNKSANLKKAISSGVEL